MTGWYALPARSPLQTFHALFQRYRRCISFNQVLFYFWFYDSIILLHLHGCHFRFFVSGESLDFKCLNGFLYCLFCAIQSCVWRLLLYWSLWFYRNKVGVDGDCVLTLILLSWHTLMRSHRLGLFLWRFCLILAGSQDTLGFNFLLWKFLLL